MVILTEWEEHALRTLTSVADIERELAHCKCRFEATPALAMKRTWQNRIRFLEIFRRFRADYDQGLISWPKWLEPKDPLKPEDPPPRAPLPDLSHFGRN